MNRFLKHILSEIHDPSTGLINSILFADVLGISYDDMAKLLNRTVPGLKKKGDLEKLENLVESMVNETSLIATANP